MFITNAVVALVFVGIFDIFLIDYFPYESFYLTNVLVWAMVFIVLEVVLFKLLKKLINHSLSYKKMFYFYVLPSYIIILVATLLMGQMILYSL